MGEGCPRYTREECRERSPAPDLSPGSLRARPVPALAAILDRCGGADDKLGLRGLLGYVRPNPVGKRRESFLLPAVHPAFFLDELIWAMYLHTITNRTNENRNISRM